MDFSRNYPILTEVGWLDEPKILVMVMDFTPGQRCQCGALVNRLDRGYCIQWACENGCWMTCLNKTEKDCNH